MTTKVKALKGNSATEDTKSSLFLMDTLKAVGQLKIDKNGNDSVLHPLMDKALTEIKTLKADESVRNFAMEVFLRNLFFVFSLQRQHNIWQQMKIKSDVLGAQMRNSGRAISRWLFKNLPDWLLYRNEDGFLYNLNLLVEFGNYDLLFHNKIKTRNKAGKTGKHGSKKDPNKIISHETMNIPVEVICELAAQNYRRDSGRSLIARWLPKFYSGSRRYSKLVVGKDIKRSKFDCTGKDWVKINGIIVEGKDVPIKEGDVITYTRKLQPETCKRIAQDNEVVYTFCRIMGWNIKQYNQFRHEYMQRTPEYMFSSGSISLFTKDEFFKWLNSLTGGQQWVVSSHLCYRKDALGELAVRPDTKWASTSLPEWYLEWSRGQMKVAEKVRTAMAKGDTAEVKRLQKEVKVKTTGLQTIDLILDMMNGTKSEDEINTLHTALISKMEMLVPVYTIIDGSGSMNNYIYLEDGRKISYINVALTLALTFMATNPVPEYRESCMWFGHEAIFTGVTKYDNTSPNPFLQGQKFTKQTDGRKIINPGDTFANNYRSLLSANPKTVSSTNAGQVVTTFMDLVKRGVMSPESLPQVLLFITDEEYNTGVGPTTLQGTGFTQIPQTIGWNPLFVFWGIKTTTRLDMYKDAPNVLVTRGFSENNLSQILQFIRKGSISMFDELFAVHEMPGLSPISYS